MELPSSGRVYAVVMVLMVWHMKAASQKSVGKIQLPLVNFQAAGPATEESLLIYKGTLKDLTQATFCFKLNIQQSRDLNTVLSYAMFDEGDEIHISLNYRLNKLVFFCCNGLWELEVDIPLGLREWIDICMAVDLPEQRWMVVKNGQVQQGNKAISTFASVMIRKGGTLVIGQDQDVPGGGFNSFESLSGRLVDLRIYDSLLTQDVMVSYTKCELMEYDAKPLVDFSNVHRDFELINVTTDSIVADKTCDTMRDFDLIFPELRVFNEGELLCRIVGGTITVPKSATDNEELFNASLPYAVDCGDGYAETLWLGVLGNVETQSWQHYLDGTPIGYSKFDERNGLPITERDTCMAFIGSLETTEEEFGLWVPSNCHLEMCPVCHFDQVGLIRMRGLCIQSEFDRDYFLTHDQGSLSFTGVYYTKITKKPPDRAVTNSTFGYWILTRFDKPDVTAMLHMTSPTHYPIGLNSWHVENDVCGKTEIELMMTSCKDGQFSCSDGTCVMIRQRCDLEADCPDASDEVKCDFVVLPDGYDALSAPSRTDRDEPVQISIHVTILSVHSLDLKKFQFTCEIMMELLWIDGRLAFHHLNFDEGLNIANEDKNFPWIPQLEFQGGGNTTSEVNELRSTLRIRRLSADSLPDEDENIFEDEIFKGHENPLVLTKKLSVTVSCTFALEAFPFDTQLCNMGILLAGVNKDYVALARNGTGVAFEGNRRLLEYYLESETMTQQDEGHSSGQTIRLRFYNMSIFYIIATYVPTFIIVIIGHLIFFFPLDLDSFNERIMVALTGLLVQATLFSQVNESIPHTAYLKLIDIWFVFCIINLFLVVVAVVLINWLQVESKVTWSVQMKTVKPSSAVKPGNIHSIPRPADPATIRRDRAELVNSACRLSFPILSALFLVGYCTAAVFMMKL